MVLPASIKIFLAFSAALSLLEVTILVSGLTWLTEMTMPLTGWGRQHAVLFCDWQLARPVQARRLLHRREHLAGISRMPAS